MRILRELPPTRKETIAIPVTFYVDAESTKEAEWIILSLIRSAREGETRIYTWERHIAGVVVGREERS